MEIRIISSLEVLKEKRKVWNKIYDIMEESTPFQSWEWNYYWLKNIEKNNVQLYILEAFEDKDTFGFAPIVIKDNEYQFIGDKHFDYGMFICAERKREIVSLFLKKLQENFHKVNLQCFPIYCSQFGLINENMKNNLKNSLVRKQVDTANINLKEYGTFEKYLKAISASLRKKAIRPCLKAELDYRIEPFSEELWRDIEIIFNDRQNDRIGNTNISWAKNIVKPLFEEGLLKISTLIFNGQRVAYLIFFEEKSINYVWLTAFKKTGKLQLGHYIRYCLIKRAFENDIIKVDMMRGAYDYKKQWDCNVSSNYEYLIFNNSLMKNSYQLKKTLRQDIRDFVYNNEKIYKLYKKIRS